MPQISGTEQDIFAYRTLGAFKNTRHKNRKASVLTLASQGWVEAFSFPRSLSSPQQVNTRFLSTLIQIINGGFETGSFSPGWQPLGFTTTITGPNQGYYSHTGCGLQAWAAMQESQGCFTVRSRSSSQYRTPETGRSLVSGSINSF